VQATLTPSDSDIKVEVWLPTSGWNGKFVGIGNGIWAGQLSYSQLGDPLKRGYAVATTDTGHTGNGLTGEFAVGHPEKLVDFGHRAVHEMVVTAKRAIAAFYGNGPQKSYWNSCSTGGRQGLMEAYRYPADFDAISAMAPANPMTDLMTQSMWAGWQPQRAPGAALSMPQLAALHAAVVKQCDKLDGLEDGLIGRPTRAGSIRRRSGGPHAARKSRRCARSTRARRPAGLAGRQRDAAGGGRGRPDAVPGGADLLSACWRSATGRVGLEDVRLHARCQAGRTTARRILDVPPTARGVLRRGGKLLLSHGWSDGLIPATNTLRFHAGCCRRSARSAGQPVPAVHGPGMDHCGGGEGASQFDTLGTIDEWATTGKAPERSSPRGRRRRRSSGRAARAAARADVAPAVPYPAMPSTTAAATRRRGEASAAWRRRSEADGVASPPGPTTAPPARRLRARRRAVHDRRHRGQLLAPARRAAGGASDGAITGSLADGCLEKQLASEIAAATARWSSASAPAPS
jgi:hypothetical protein